MDPWNAFGYILDAKRIVTLRIVSNSITSTGNIHTMQDDKCPVELDMYNSHSGNLCVR